MSIENDLNRIATALEGLLAYATGLPVEKKGPGRPAKQKPDTSVSPAPQDAPAAASVAGEPLKPAAEMPVIAAPAGGGAVAPAPTAATADVGVTVEQLQKLVGEKVGLGKREGVLAKIAASGADRASTVPADQRDAVYAAIKAL